MEIKKIKEEIRIEVKEKRRNLNPDDEYFKNEKIFNKVITSKAFQEFKCIYCYVSFLHEVSTTKLILHALSIGKTVAVPRVDGRNIEFFYIRNLEDLEPGCMKILEPKTYCKRALEENVLVILPGLAFDKSGHRVGYGGGYYDRYLKDKSDYYILGIAFDFQIYDKLPTESFDCIADQVITDD